ncbi:hypothetical protein JCM10213_003867 [Rhodosporidiobolus nylandii]
MAPLVLTDDSNKLKTVRKLGSTLPPGVDPRTRSTTVRVHESLYSTWLDERQESGRWVRRDRIDDSTRAAKRARAAAQKERDGRTTVSRTTRRPAFEWSEKIVCDHAGTPDKRVLDPLDPNRQRQALKRSIKVGCGAHFVAKKHFGDVFVEIEVVHEHSGHAPGTVTDMNESRMSLQAREWLRSQVAQGSSWPTIKALLRCDKTQLKEASKPHSQISSLSEALRVEWQDAYNHIRRAILSATRLASNAQASTDLWIERLRGEGWRAEHIRVHDATGAASWALCLMSGWQEEILEVDGAILCMDSTHNTSYAHDPLDKAFLYTLVAKHGPTGKGIPVCFMLTPSETQYPVTAWLRWLSDELPTFRPRFIMADCSATEAAAVREWLAHEDDERAKPHLLWCHYHLFKALGGLDAGREGFAEFKKLVDATSEDVFNSAWTAFRARYSSTRHRPWLQYMTGYCYPARERWSCAWRQDVLFDIHTNNLVEAWHRQLKAFYLGMMRRQRVDFLIHVLAECVLPDYQAMVIKHKLGFSRRRLDKAEAKRRNEAQAVPSDLAVEMCYEDVNGELSVESFQDSAVRYSIALNSSGAISACSCPDHTQKRMLCKHMWLLQRVTNHALATPTGYRLPVARPLASSPEGGAAAVADEEGVQPDVDHAQSTGARLQERQDEERAARRAQDLAVLMQVRAKEAELNALVRSNYGGLDGGVLDLTPAQRPACALVPVDLAALPSAPPNLEPPFPLVMPSKPVVKHEELDHSYRLRYSCDIEFDITDVNLKFSHPLPLCPLKGTWFVDMVGDSEDLYIGLRYGKGQPRAVFGQSVVHSTEVAWLAADGTAHQLYSSEATDAVPDVAEGGKTYAGFNYTIVRQRLAKGTAASNGKYDPATHRSYRIIFTLEHAYPKSQATTHAAVLEGLARRTAGLNLEQLPHNVRLFFPYVHKDGAALWIKGDILSRSSPYLKDLLSSDFAEAQPRRSKRARTSGAAEVAPAPAQEEKDIEDSDDETDEFLFSKKPPSLSSSSEADDISFRQVTVTQTAFSTYHAILVYLQTGFIHFAPLSSSFPLVHPAFSTRRDFLASKHDEDPSLPLLVSPSAAYRLAHLLQLADLQERCLNEVRASLTVQGAAAELFSDTSVAYEELRKVVLEFVKENWAKVRESEGWKDCEAKAERDEVPSSLLLAVLRAVAKE